jgi:hypothetical protein
MATRVAVKKTADAPAPQVSQLAEVAENIRDDAIVLARRRLTPLQRDAGLEILFQNPSFFGYFKYELTVGVADALAENDRHVLAMYHYDPSANPGNWAGEDMDATVHAIALVSVTSAALEALVSSLDRALTASLKDLPAPQFAQRESILDVVLVTEEEVELGKGYAKMLSSVFAPPLKIWERAS